MEKQSEKKKIKKKQFLIQLLIGGVIGLIIGIIGITFIDNFSNGEFKLETLILIALFIFISIFININIHEFGHLIFGKMFSYKLMSYRISFLAWNNENGKMKFSIIKNKGYGGLCAMIPPEQELVNYKNGLFYAGGIILNILTGSIFLIIAFFYSNITEIANLFFILMGVIALFFGFVNLLPLTSYNNPTDGKIIWSLILKKPFAKKLIEVNRMSAQLSAGTRPRDLKISLPVNIDNPQMLEMMKILYLYFKALDNNNIENMNYYADLLEKNIENFPNQALPAIYYELCFLSCISNDEDKAKLYYEKGGKILKMDKDINGLRVKAYYEYYINKDEKLSMKLCDEAMLVADKFPIKGQGLLEKDLIESLRELIINEKNILN